MTTVYLHANRHHSSNWRRSMIAALSASILLSACGGGSGGGDDTNQAPDIQDQTLTLAAGSSDTVALNVSDPEGDTLTLSVVSPASHGTATVTNAADFSYQHTDTFIGTDTATVRATDAAGNTDDAIVTITISNSAPTLSWDVDPGQPTLRAGGATQSWGFSGSDTEGHTLTYTITTPPAEGTATLTASTLDYLPATTAWSGPITISASDGYGGQTTLSILLDVVDGDAVVINDQTLSIGAGTSSSFTLTLNNPDGDTVTGSVLAAPSHGTASIAGTTLTYAHTDTFIGSDAVVVEMADTQGADTATVHITITNQLPTVVDVSTSAGLDEVVMVTLDGSDPDGHALSYEIVTPPDLGSIGAVNGAEVSYSAPSVPGTTTFTYRAFDGYEYGDTATVSIVINDNIPPVVTGPVDLQRVLAGSSVAITLVGADSDGDSLTWQVDRAPNHGDVTISGNVATYTHTGDWEHDPFTVTANDGRVASAPFSIDVVIDNNQPTAVPITARVLPDDDVVIRFIGDDSDGHDLEYLISTPPANGTLSPIVGDSVTFTADGGASGIVTFTYRAADEWSISAPATVTIHVATLFELVYLAEQTESTGDIDRIDLDLDGDQDLLIYDREGFSLMVYENIAGGQAWRPHLLATGIKNTTNQQVAAGDVTGDGRPEVVFMQTDRALKVLSSAGDLDFWSEIATIDTGLMVPSAHMAVTLADVDGANGLDIIHASPEAGIQAFINDGTGTGWSANPVAAAADVGNVFDLVDADINGDGHADLVVADGSNEHITLYLNGDGSGTTWPATEIASSIAEPYSLQVFDIDGDTDLDVLFSSPSEDRIAYSRNDPAGWSLVTLADSQIDAKEFVLTDVNSDGHVDLIVTQLFGNQVRYLQNNQDLTFTSTDVYSVNDGFALELIQTDSATTAVAAGSWNSDGISRLTTTDGGATWTQDFLSPSASHFKGVDATDSGLSSGSAIAAINDDGGGSEVWIFNLLASGDRIGAAITHTSLRFHTDSSDDVLLVDPDVDGISEMLTGKRLYQQNGGPDDWTFSEPGIGRSIALEPIALDGDATPTDVAMIDDAGVLIVARLAAGTYQTVRTVQAQTRLKALAIGDVNADSRNDLIVANTRGVWAYQQPVDPADTWTEVAIDASMTGIGGLAAADLDGDGRVEIAVASADLFLYRHGSPWTQEEVDSSFVGDAADVVFADIDDDSDWDLVVAQTRTSQVAWYENGNNWLMTIAASGLAGPYRLAVFDADGDGIDDILVTGGRGSLSTFVAALLNRVSGTGTAVTGVQ